MGNCINMNHKDFKTLAEMSGLNPLVLSAKMGVWMDKNNTDTWPTLEQIGINIKLDSQRAFDFSDRIFKSNLFKELLYKFDSNTFNFSDLKSLLYDTLNDRNKYLLNHISNTIGRNVQIKFVSSYEKISAFGDKINEYIIYDAKTDTIYIDKMHFESNQSNSNNSPFSTMLMHELLHSVTVFKLKELENLSELGDKNAISQLAEIVSIFNRAKMELSNSFPGYTNDLYEFVAGLSDENFVKELDLINYEDSKSILDKIIDFIRDVFGLRNGSLAFAAFNSVLRLSSENLAAMPSTKEQLGKFAMSGDLSGLHESTQKIVEDGKDIEVEMVENEATGKLEQGQHYINKSNGNIYNRITYGLKSFIQMFTTYKSKTSEDFAKEKVDKIWGSRDHEMKVSIDGKLYNYDEYYDFYKSIINKGAGKGQLLHKLNERVNAKSQQDIDKIDQEMREIATEYGVDENTVSWFLETSEHGGKKYEHGLLYEKIYDVLGINKFNKEIPQELKDKVITEVPVHSDLIKNSDGEGFAGSVDMIVEHQENFFDENGEVGGNYISIYDLKSGYAILDKMGTSILKFGEQQKWITNSSIDMAKLQIAIYAVLIKLNNPDQRFKNLQIAMLQNKWEATNFNPKSMVEVESYIPMIEAFFKDKKSMIENGLDENLYSQMISKSKNLFNVNHYRYVSNKNSENLTIEQINNKLIILENSLNKADVVNNRREQEIIKEQMEKLRNKKIQLENDYDSQANFLSESEAPWTGLMKRMLGGLFDSENKLIKAFGAAWTKAYKRYSEKSAASLIGIKPLIDNLRKEHMKKMGLLKFIESDYVDMYSVLLKKDIIENVGEVERLILESDVEWNGLSQTQKDFILKHESLMQKYLQDKNSYFNKKASEDFSGNPISHLQLSNPDFIYYPGFFPKTAPSDIEIRRKSREEGAFSNVLNKDYWKLLLAKKLDFVDENLFENYDNKKTALPIKYLGNNNGSVSNYYSKDLGESLVKFINWAEYKEAMDATYAIGKSVVYHIQDKSFYSKSTQDRKNWANESRILEGFLKIEVQGIKRLDDDFFGGKGFRVATNPLDGTPVHFVPQKFLDLFSKWARSTTIWLNPKSATGNLTAQSWLGYRNSLKDDISKWFIGNENAQTDMDTKSFSKANADMAELVKDMMFGNLYNNKLWKMMEYHNYINGNTMNAVRRISSTVRERTTVEEGMMALQSVSEFWTLGLSYSTQMNHMKLKDGRSFYEAYNVNDDGSVSWTGGIRGKLMMSNGSYTNLEELDSMEIKRLQRVHEKLYGSYRPSEFTGLEMYVFGKFFLVLKKYFQRTILNLFDPSKEDFFLGEYKNIGQLTIDGETYDSYSWKGREVEAKIKGVFRLFALPWYLVSGNYKDKMESLSYEQKKNMLEAFQTYLNMVVMIGLYMLFFGDTPDDDAIKKWWSMYMIDNAAQQYNPIDIARSLSNLTPVGFKRAFETGQALASIGGAIISDDKYTQEGNLRGWVPLQKSIPFVSSYYKIIRDIQSLEVTEGEEKTRNLLVDWFGDGRTAIR